MIIKICKDFSETPGARYKTEGKYSGEEFRDTILKPAFIKCNQQGEPLILDLDGGYGYPTSFLEEAFGGLAREFGEEKVNSILKFISNDEPSLEGEIRKYILLSKERKNEKK